VSVSQQLNQPELNWPGNDRTERVRGTDRSETPAASWPPESPTGSVRLMERILEWDNVRRALKRVRRNKGAPGVDGMTVEQLPGYLRRHWPKIHADLLHGRYVPLPVRRKAIPKPDGGERLLGIPAVLDRVVQQAVAQVLQAMWDPTFSESSFGFRPGRSQHQAIRQARDFVRAGYRVTVDMDLSKFFDRVNHDRLLSRLATRVEDKQVLRLIRAFLTSGVMVGGLVSPTEEGTPQGGPLSPLLSNIVLDELDRELERRGLHFVRYADDLVIHVKSKRAGQRVMDSVKRYVTRTLRLKINEEKSSVGRPWSSKFLGFCLTNSRTAPKIRIHWKSIKRFRQRVVEITSRTRGRSLNRVLAELMSYMRGWWQYYGIAESRNRLQPLAHWIRRRFRALVWKQWKNRRTRIRNLLGRGIERVAALTTGCARKGPWRMSRVYWVHLALPDSYFVELGLQFPWIDLA
jgi:RNA-directed DNA polymerase